MSANRNISKIENKKWMNGLGTGKRIKNGPNICGIGNRIRKIGKEWSNGNFRNGIKETR